jgi:hypothetical protein
VITAATVRQQIRMAALFNGTEPEESFPAFEAMRDSLIDRMLILEEMRISRYAIPEGGEVQPALDREMQQAGGPEKWASLLTRYRLSEEQVRLSLRYQAAIVRFTVYRFRPAVQVTTEEIRRYYDSKLTVQPKPPLDEVRDQIETIIRREQINVLLNKWLAEVRQQTHIETYEELKP